MTKLSFEDWKNSTEIKQNWVLNLMLAIDAEKHNKTVEEIKDTFLQGVYQLESVND